MQFFGLTLRKILPWAVLFAAAYVARMAWDMFAPPSDFHLRSQISTAVAVAILLGAGYWATWQSRLLFAGAAAGFGVTALASILSAAGLSAILALWHDPLTLDALASAGGLDEALVLPVMLIVPGVVIGAVGGLLGAGVRRLSAA